MNYQNKCIITAAITGAGTRKEQNPAVPYGVREIVEDAVSCYEAGAAIVHIHARDDDGKSTENPEIVGAIVDGIRKRCPVLINLSTAIGVGKTPEQRISVVKNHKPDLASLNCGTMNFAKADWHTGNVLGETVFYNTFKMIEEFNEEMKKAGTKPELEVYDLGQIDNVLLLQKKGIFKEPLHFQFVFGVAGGVRLTPDIFSVMLNRIPEDATWSVCGVGLYSFKTSYLGAIFDGHIRVGLEDNLYISGKILAKGNFELVEKAVQIVRIADREPAIPDEAGEILKLK